MPTQRVWLFVGLALIAALFFFDPDAHPVQPRLHYVHETPATHGALQQLTGRAAGLDTEGRVRLIGERKDELVFSLPGGAPRFTNVHLCGWTDGGATQELALTEIGSGRDIVLSRRPVLRHRNFDITRFLKSEKTYAIRYRVEGPPGSSAILSEFSVGRSENLPRFPVFHWFFFLAALGFGATDFWKRRSVGTASILAVIGAVAFWTRWNGLAAGYGMPLEGDSLGYQAAAVTLNWRHPFQTALREPFYIWLQAAVRGLFGSNDFYFRATTAALSVGIAVLTAFLTLKTTRSKTAGFVAGLMMALGDFSVFNATRGERSELTVFLLMVFFLILFTRRSSHFIEAMLGVVAGLAALTWLVTAVTVLIAYVARWFVYRLSWQRALLFFAAGGFMVAPQLFVQWKNTGDPLNSINFTVSFYRNARETGEPSYEGEKMSWAHYFFKKQGVPRLAVSTLKNTAALFLNPFDPNNKLFLGFHPSMSGSYAVYPFLILGLLSSAVRTNKKGWLFLFSVTNVTVSFLPEIRDPRLFLQMAPVFAYFTGSGVAYAREMIDMGIRKRKI